MYSFKLELKMHGLQIASRVSHGLHHGLRVNCGLKKVLSRQCLDPQTSPEVAATSGTASASKWFQSYQTWHQS
jgi:hypothetical protein